MKMNMKNNKTMLALVVVAALAMVSVAGVALATNDDSDAASTGTTYLNSGNITLENMTANSNYYVYNVLDGVAGVDTTVTITIASTATFTGYIYFGDAVLVDGKPTATGTPSNSLYFDGVSDVTVTVDVTVVDPETATSVTTINGSTTGSVTVHTGAVTLGVADSPMSDDNKSYTGDVYANGAKFDAEYIAGATISVETVDDVTTAYITGIVMGCFNDVTDVDADDVLTLTGNTVPTLTVTGNFTINYASDDVFYVEYALFVIADNSVATLLENSELQNDGAVIVDGTLNVKNMDELSVDSIDNNGILYVSGLITYVTDPYIAQPIDDGFLSASYYSKVTYVTILGEVTDIPAYTTHYYTTLANALSSSDAVTVYGVALITEDLTLSGEKTVTLAEDAEIIVGIPDVQVDIEDALSTLLTANELGMITDVMSVFGLTGASFEPSYATITIADDATLDVTNGDFIVLNGKVVASAMVEDENNVIGDITSTVEMQYENHTIYTNLETALDLATSGDTIELSWVGYLFSDSTVAAGVTVDANDQPILVYSGVTLNINGNLNEVSVLFLTPGVDATITRDAKAFSISLDAATLNLNSGSLTVGAIYLGGTFNVASTFDNISEDATDAFYADAIFVFSASGTGSYDGNVETGIADYLYYVDVSYTFATTTTAVLNVNGDIDFGYTQIVGAVVLVDDATVDVTGGDATIAVNVKGTLVSGALFASEELLATVDVTGDLIIAADVTDGEAVGIAFVPQYIDDLTVSTTGSVTEDGGLLNVDTVTSGTPATSFNGVANGAVIQISGAVGYATIYGITDAGAISFNSEVYATEFYIADGVLYLTLFTNDDVLYAGYYAPSVPGYNFLGWYDDNGSFITSYTLTHANVGAYPNLYASFEAIKYNVTLEYQANGYWMVNNVNFGNGGSVTLDWAESYTITFTTYDGYYWAGKVLANGTPITSTYVPTNGDYLTLSPAVVPSTITLGYTQHGYWVVNDVTYLSGTVNVSTANATKITFVADSDYELKNSSILVNGTQKSSSSTLTYTAAAGDTVTFGGAVDQKVVDDSGLSVTDILLIVITIVIIVIAIIVALRLMRS